MVKHSLLKKGLVTAILVISVLAMFTAVASAGDPPCTCGNICVNETGWWRHDGAFNASDTPIQAAVNNATSGETICVKDGMYHENVVVNVAHLTIRSQNGSANCTVNASNSGDHVFNVAVDYVNISGFTVENATGNWKAGIYLNGREHCNISDNNVTNNFAGIYLSSSSNNNTLTNNNASNNTLYDFYSDESSHDNVIEDLTIASYPTTISFTYDQGIMIKGVTTPPADPALKSNIDKYVNAANVTANSWLFLNVSYTDNDVSDVEEDSLLLYRWNGTAWELAVEFSIEVGHFYM